MKGRRSGDGSPEAESERRGEGWLPGRPSRRTQQHLARGLQAALLGLVGLGLLSTLVGYDGWSGQTKVVVNGSIALGITALPAALERNYELPIDPWLGLWITTAVFLHALGSAGFYNGVWWWDHLTHALSATLVAGVGYTAMRAIDLHTDEIQLPHRYAFVVIVLFVLAFGVLWELFEYGLDVASATTGVEMPLAQHGVDDTAKDLLFNTLGALVVAAFGQAHLTGLADEVRDLLVAAD